MLQILGFGMIITFMYLIMSKRLYAMTALILIPILFALLGGFYKELGTFMMDGVKKIAPTGVMLIFGILYFSVMIEVGLFDPLVARILKMVKGDPVKITVGTAILSLLVSLDGDCATTYLIVTAAMLPLYRRLGMNPLILTAIAILSGGVMNILPWGGPTARVLSVLHLTNAQVFTPIIPVMIAGAGFVVFVAWHLGRKERIRLKKENPVVPVAAELAEVPEDAGHSSLKRPGLVWFNTLLTVALLVGLILEVMPIPVLFTTSFALALVVNFPKLEDQHNALRTHAGNALAVGGMIFAAGIFTGILSGSLMMDAMARVMIDAVPQQWGAHFPVITGLASAPLTFFMSNDAFFFGIMPLVAETGAHFSASVPEMGRASLLGAPVHLLSPLVPSTYLLVGLAGVSFADHLRFTLKWACGVTLVMLIAALCMGVISF